MRKQWINECLEAAVRPSSFYSGCRKIHRGYSFTITKIADDLKMEDVGYSKYKQTILTKGYLHAESRDMAVKLWEGRLARKKYGSVGFHCFSHLVKGGDLETKRSKRASVMGPCIQSVSVTLDNNGHAHVDLFYRTTELFKKFPADLVFIRDVLLAPFDFTTAPLKSLNFHFANVTCHPMYFVTLLHMLDDPIGELEHLKKKDKFFFDWTVKWTARFLCPEYHRGIAKFAQALRVKKAADESIPPKLMKTLQKYLRDNHPGYKGDYQDDTDPDE